MTPDATQALPTSALNVGPLPESSSTKTTRPESETRRPLSGPERVTGGLSLTPDLVGVVEELLIEVPQEGSVTKDRGSAISSTSVSPRVSVNASDSPASNVVLSQPTLGEDASTQRYQLRKRSAEQLAATQPPKRTRRSPAIVEVFEIETINDRRGPASAYEYRVSWADSSESSWLPRQHLIEDGNQELIEIMDKYLARHPNREISYQEFVARSCRALLAMADNEDNSCVAHAIQMAFELMDLTDASQKLPDIWQDYVAQAKLAGVNVTNGFKKVEQIARYCRYAVPKSGWSIDVTQLRRNLFDGNGAGYLAIARRVLPMPNVVLDPGVYLVGVYKKNMRGHCFAMQVNNHGEVIIRENGINTGLGENCWFRTISFIRSIKVFATPNDWKPPMK